MTSKERLHNLMNGKPIDRCPVWMLFPLERITYARDIFGVESYREVIELIHKKCDFFERRSFPYKFCYNGNPEMINDNGRIRYRDVELTCFHYDTQGNRCREPYIKTPEDIDKILSIPYVPDYSGIDIEKEEAFKSRMGDRGVTMVMLDDPVEILHTLCDETDFCLLCYEEEERVLRFLDEMLRRCMDRYRYFLEKGIGDVFWMAGSEFCVPPMLSPSLFRKYVTPYSKALVDMIHSYGKKVMIHCHGRIGMLLEEFKQIGMDLLHPVEAAPMGDCTLAQARAVLGNDVALVGNIQVGDIYSCTKDEIRQIVKDAMLEGKKGRFVLAMTASPIYPELDDHLKENYIAVVETALEYAAMS